MRPPSTAGNTLTIDNSISYSPTLYNPNYPFAQFGACCSFSFPCIEEFVSHLVQCYIMNQTFIINLLDDCHLLCLLPDACVLVRVSSSRSIKCQCWWQHYESGHWRLWTQQSVSAWVALAVLPGSVYDLISCQDNLWIILTVTWESKRLALPQRCLGCCLVMFI